LAIFGGLFAMMGFSGKYSVIIFLLLSVFGIITNYFGINIIRKQREYYMELLAKKALFEHHFKFYEKVNFGIKPILPWSLNKKQLDKIICANSEKLKQWIDKNVFPPGSISQKFYTMFLLIYWFYGLFIAVFLIEKIICYKTHILSSIIQVYLGINLQSVQFTEAQRWISEIYCTS
jgi:hypothetical protein